MGAMTARLFTLAERPDLEPAMEAMATSWPEFMFHDPVAHLYFGQLAAWAEFVLVLVDDETRGDESGGDREAVIAKAFSVPFVLTGDPIRERLPAAGWDRVVAWAARDHREQRPTDTVSALEISIRPDHQGTGLSSTLVTAMRDNAKRLGYHELVAPVRPNRKAAEPRTPMAEYARRTRADGLPADDWLRVHVRLGGVIERVAEQAMTITGSLADWREWTGLPFDESGLSEVPGALVPVHVSVEHDYAVYVEPNVWIRHSLA